MTDTDTSASDRPMLPSYTPGSRIDFEEIRDLLRDDGYSADARKDWLKSILTGIAQDEARSSEDRSRLEEELRAQLEKS